MKSLQGQIKFLVFVALEIVSSFAIASTQAGAHLTSVIDDGSVSTIAPQDGEASEALTGPGEE